jgi:excisionase family DNA binding protein
MMRELLTYEDVARITKFKISTLRKWVLTGKMPFLKINGAIRFTAEALQAWTAGKERGERGGAAAARSDRTGELFSEGQGSSDEGL